MSSAYFLGLGRIFLTGIVAGPVDSHIPRAFEFCACDVVSNSEGVNLQFLVTKDGTGRVPGTSPPSDQFQYYLFTQTDTPPTEQTLELSEDFTMTERECMTVASDATKFQDFFGYPPTFTWPELDLDGNDALRIIQADQISQTPDFTVFYPEEAGRITLSTFGNAHVDGTGQFWDYHSGWAYLKSEADPAYPFGTAKYHQLFPGQLWTFSGPNALDNVLTNADTVVPLGTFSFANSCPPGPTEEDLPTPAPSSEPSELPSTQPSSSPSQQPSNQPSLSPSSSPSSEPSAIPSDQPSVEPSNSPTNEPKNQDDKQTDLPSSTPSEQPSSFPSEQPSSQPSVAPSVTLDMFDISYQDATFVDSSNGNKEPATLNAIKLDWIVGDDGAQAKRLSVDFEFYEAGCTTKLDDSASAALSNGPITPIRGQTAVSLTNTLSALTTAGLRRRQGNTSYKYSFCAAILFYDEPNGNGQVGNIQYVNVEFLATINDTIQTGSATVTLDTVGTVDDTDNKGMLTASLYPCSSTSGSMELDESNVDLYSGDAGALTSERKPLYLCVATDNNQVKIRHIKSLSAYFQEGDSSPTTSQVLVFNKNFQGPLSVDNQGGVGPCKNAAGSEVSECKFAVFLRGDEFPTDDQLKSVTFTGSIKLILESDVGNRRRHLVRSLSTTETDYDVETVVTLNARPENVELDEDVRDENDGCIWSFLNVFGMDAVCRLMSAFNNMVSRLSSMLFG